LLIFLAAELQGLEPKVVGKEVLEISINKTLFLCSHMQSMRELTSSGHGNAEEDDVHVVPCLA
jgi:hypothetical protein